MHNNRELRRFVDEHNLSYDDVSKLIGVPFETSRNWLRSEGSSQFRRMSDLAFQMFQMKADMEFSTKKSDEDLGDQPRR